MSSLRIKPKIGIVSGVGPLAGADVLQKVLKYAAQAHNAIADDEYPEVILINKGIPGVDNTGALSEQFKDGISDMVGQLESNASTIIGIACNTAHVYFDDIAVLPTTHLVHLIDSVAKRTVQNNGPALLLSSSATKSQKLYHTYLEKHNVPFIETSDSEQKILDAAIEKVMAHQLIEAGELMQKLLQTAHTKHVSAIIAGCTELPIAIDHALNTFGLEIIDSNQILAEELVSAYYAELKGHTHITEHATANSL